MYVDDVTLTPQSGQAVAALEYFSSANLVPPINSVYITPSQFHALYANGIIKHTGILAVGGDHAGFLLKQWLAGRLARDGHEIVDLGAHDTTPSDYPDFARAIGEAVTAGRAERGILVCGSGIGASVAANKIRGVRAGLAHDTYSGHQGVEHDDMNVLCLGARVVGMELALEVCRAFLQARFSGEERHRRRVGKILELDRR